MTELTWDNLRVATEAGNHAFSPLEMLGRVSVLLAQDMQAVTSNAFDNDAALARRALSTVEDILANRRQRNGGRDGKDLVEVAKATEVVLEKAAGLFRRNQWGEPYDVLAECGFHEAAKVVCNDNGHSLHGVGSLRFGEQDTMDPEEARRIIQSDRARRSTFERMSHDDWLRHSRDGQRHRVDWKPAAEMWARLALQLDVDLPSDPPRLPRSPESPSLVSS